MYANGLSEIPAELCTLNTLEEVSFGGNQLTAVPLLIGSCTELLTLKLYANKIAVISSEIRSFAALQELRLEENQLTTLPPEIGQLNGLQMLLLNNNSLTTLPPEIGQLTALQTLDLHSNELTTLPPVIAQLTALQNLDLHSNQLTTLPPVIAQLTALQNLDLHSNQLTTLPPVIAQLTALQTLYLHENQLTTLPPEIGQLTALQTLYLHENQLTKLPPEIGQLTALQNLDLETNKLTQLPEALSKLEKLERLFLHENGDLGLPVEVLGPRREKTEGYGGSEKPANPAELLKFYFRTRSLGPQGTRALNEFKVIVVGQGSVGKTSLVKRIVYNTFDKREKKTPGIYINKDWRVPGKRKGEEVQVNFWDFGGQEIMHATHQFFLTKRTVYLLVLDARKGENESNIHYWLKVIRSFGGDSPVLIVVNKCETHHLDLNQTRLKKDYPNIVGFHETSCEKGTGIDKLKAAIAKQVKTKAMKHIFDPLPKAYFDVKQELEKLADAKSYISLREYHQLCAKHTVTDQEEQDVLLRFLHDLGSVLSFNDPENPYAMREMSVLQPEWVTKGVYKILNDETLKKTYKGLLRKADVARILKGKKHPATCHPFITDMMGKFELSFASEEDKSWLVAELLPADEPKKLPTDTTALNFEFKYDVLPPGIICRFIVRRYRNLGKKPIYWRSGVVLEFEECKAVIRSDTDEGRMYISILGAETGRRAALEIIRDEFAKIHRTIPNLTPTELVPLFDNPSVKVEFKHLQTLARERVGTFIPQGASKPYYVRELLDGIAPPWGQEGPFLYPPFFRSAPQAGFPDAWEVFCCDILNRFEKTADIRRRAAPEGGIDLLWKKDKKQVIAYQCKSVESGKTGDFDVTSAVASWEAAKAQQKEMGWTQYVICTNVELTGRQESNLRERCTDTDVRLLTPSFWIPRCQEQWREVQGRFAQLSTQNDIKRIEPIDDDDDLPPGQLDGAD